MERVRRAFLSQEEFERRYRKYPFGLIWEGLREPSFSVQLGKALQANRLNVRVMASPLEADRTEVRMSADSAEIMEMIQMTYGAKALAFAMHPSKATADRAENMARLNSLLYYTSWPESTRIQVGAYYLNNLSKHSFAKMLALKELGEGRSITYHFMQLAKSAKDEAKHLLLERADPLPWMTLNNVQTLLGELIRQKVPNPEQEDMYASFYGRQRFLLEAKAKGYSPEDYKKSKTKKGK